MSHEELREKQLLNTSAYESKVKELAEIEKSFSEQPSAEIKDKLRAIYRNLLDQWPHLEGFWIRWAHAEFRMGSSDQALHVFKTALAIPILDRSLYLWTEYFRFRLRICNDQDNVDLRTEFEGAAQKVGSHFLSHEFWDLFLEVSEEPVRLLIHILSERTLHQCARFYAQILELLDTVHLFIFQEAMSLQSELSISSKTTEIRDDEAARMRAVIASKLQLRYELHLRRVNFVFPYEEKIVRPFFYPKPLVDAQAWIEYAKAVSDPEHVYRRALIPGCAVPQIWLSYIRFKIRCGASDADTRLVYEMASKMGLVPVLLHYALWLEFKGDLSYAKFIYEKSITLASANNTAVQSQFREFSDRVENTNGISHILPKADDRDTDVVVSNTLTLDDEKYYDNDL